MESIFTRHTKLSEILRSNWQLAALFPRLHIYWGFGEQTIEQYCTEHHLSADFAIMICNAYTFENYSPQKTDFINFNCQDLTDFLLNSHVFYLQKRLPHIKQHLQHVVPAEHEMAAIVNRFFNDYIQEVQAHFEYEEKIVSPIFQDYCLTPKIRNTASIYLKNSTTTWKTSSTILSALL